MEIENNKEFKFEFAATLIMSLAAMLTAWCAFQSSLWNSVQTFELAKFNQAGIKHAELITWGHQQKTVDTLTFMEFVNAYKAGNESLAEFYRARFRPEFKPAFEAWMAKSPFTDPSAPPHPFDMPEYRLALLEEVKKFSKENADSLKAAQNASTIADNYMLQTVIFSLVLFFCGINSQIKKVSVRTGLLIVGGLLGIMATLLIISYPVNWDVKPLITLGR